MGGGGNEGERGCMSIHNFTTLRKYSQGVGLWGGERPVMSKGKREMMFVLMFDRRACMLKCSGCSANFDGPGEGMQKADGE